MPIAGAVHCTSPQSYFRIDQGTDVLGSRSGCIKTELHVRAVQKREQAKVTIIDCSAILKNVVSLCASLLLDLGCCPLHTLTTTLGSAVSRNRKRRRAEMLVWTLDECMRRAGATAQLCSLKLIIQEGGFASCASGSNHSESTAIGLYLNTAS
jgi:hypothetical protein